MNICKCCPTERTVESTVIRMETELKRRDKHDIVLDILKIARSAKRKTHIMYKAKLSYDQLKTYLELLNDRGLLESNDGFYRTTSKGLDFIKTYEEISLFKASSGNRIINNS
jgi:predicted transcriptional regulator